MHVAPIKKRTPIFSDWGSKNLKQVQIKERQRHTLPQIAVPSAQAGLTSLFEMGRGEPRRNNHLKVVLLAVVGFGLLVFPSTTNHQLSTAATLQYLNILR